MVLCNNPDIIRFHRTKLECVSEMAGGISVMTVVRLSPLTPASSSGRGMELQVAFLILDLRLRAVTITTRPYREGGLTGQHRKAFSLLSLNRARTRPATPVLEVFNIFTSSSLLNKTTFPLGQIGF